VAPNRASLWAQVERSPFAYGRPFNRESARDAAARILFVPERWDTRFVFSADPLAPAGAQRHRLGAHRPRLWPRLAGVHIVDSSKSLYALALNDKVAARKRVLAPRVDRGTILNSFIFNASLLRGLFRIADK
jgi:hypothetical protein